MVPEPHTEFKMKRAVVSLLLLVVIGGWAMLVTAQTAQVSLTDRKWNLTEANGIAVKDSDASLRFDPQTNKFHGSGGCGFIGGSYKVNGTDLRIFHSYLTRRACQDPQAEKIEKEFMKVLSSATRLWIFEDTLRLYKDDQLLLVFNASTGKPD